MNRSLVSLSVLIIWCILGARLSSDKDVCDLSTYRRVFVIEASRTDTRLMYFIFKLQNGNDGKQLKVSDVTLQTNQKVTKAAPMSSFDSVAKLPQLDNLIDKLLQDARDSAAVPDECLPTIPVYLKATADAWPTQEHHMRELCFSKFELMLRNSTFEQPTTISSKIRTTEEERGIYAWIATNYLTGTLGRPVMQKLRYSMLELGRGSLLVSADTYNTNYEGRGKSYNLFGENVKLYIQSYPHLGIQKVRERFFDDQHKSKCLHIEAEVDSALFGSSSKKVLFTGESIKDEDRFEHCNQLAKGIVSEMAPLWKGVKYPNNIQSVNAFYDTIKNVNSYFHRCHERKEAEGCLQQDSFSWTVAFVEIYAEYVCKNPPKKSDNVPATLCIDMVYVLNVLANGLGITNKHKLITFSNEISGNEVSWALGFAVKESFPSHTSGGPIYSYTIISLLSPMFLCFYAFYL